jgi:hypothetical protein
MSIRFEIYRDGARVMHFTPQAPMALGPESVPMPAEISFKDGYLIVTRTDEFAMGLALLWDAGPAGAFHLETTRLQSRDRAYNLNVELARARLMKIVQKQEDWNLFDFPKAEKFQARFKEAQNLFSDALGKADTAGEAAKLADQSLAISLELSEQLAVFHSDLLINRRKASNGFVKHIFGARVDPEVQNQKYKDTAAGSFDYVVLPTRWKQIQPQEQTFEAASVDEWVDALGRKRIPIIAGPLIDLTEGEVPDWMYIWEHDVDTLRELAYEQVQRVVTRYRKVISAWNVVAGIHTNSVFTLSFEQIIELTRLLVAQVKTLLPTARTMVTVKFPFGEYHARSRASVPPMLYAEMVAQAGISFEAFGVELEMGVPTPGSYMRDLFQFSSILDRFSTLGRPLFLTAIGVPGRGTTDPHDQSEGKLDPNQAGRWKRPWDAELQAEWLDAAYRLALSKPFVESIAWGNLADQGATLPAGGLLDDMLRPKLSFNKIQQLREQFHPFQRKA